MREVAVCSGRHRTEVQMRGAIVVRQARWLVFAMPRPKHRRRRAGATEFLAGMKVLSAGSRRDDPPDAVQSALPTRS